MRSAFLIGSLTLVSLLLIPPVYAADSGEAVPELTPSEVRDTQKDLSDTTGAANQTHSDLEKMMKEPDFQELKVDNNTSYEDAASQTHSDVAAGKEDAANQTHSDVIKDAPKGYSDTSGSNQ